MEGRELRVEDALRLASSDGDVSLLLKSVAAVTRQMGKGTTIGYSRKVFIPLTNLCRDYCGYCVFRKDPSQSDAKSMTPEEVLSVAQAGRRHNCTEALFTLG